MVSRIQLLFRSFTFEQLVIPSGRPPPVFYSKRGASTGISAAHGQAIAFSRLYCAYCQVLITQLRQIRRTAWPSGLPEELANNLALPAEARSLPLLGDCRIKRHPAAALNGDIRFSE